VLSSLNNVREQLISLVKNVGVHQAKESLNNTLIINGITPVIKSLYAEVGLRYAKMYYSELIKEPEVKALPGLGFSQTWVNNITEILLRFLTDKILFKTSETTKNLLINILNKGINEGWSVDKMVSELEDFPGLKYQAERIVRTEVNRAASMGITEAGKSFKYEQMKEWISIRDTRTRGAHSEDHANHLSMNGQRVDFDSVFIDPRNGDHLVQPGDPSAKGESTINCRCTMGLIAKRDERGRLIPKRNITVIRNFNRPQRTITI
jgi:hypothetical protein